jgi:hypothetical protein
MAQEFTINSSAIEPKINQLLPSQGGFGAGIDFSASTMVIPIVDLTESAEGSLLRQDLQSSLSHGSVTAFSVANATSTLINTTGYFRVFGNASINAVATGSGRSVSFSITDGSTPKQLVLIQTFVQAGAQPNVPFDFIVFLAAGDSLTCTSNNANAVSAGCTRQIADISGNLVNPL